MSLPSVTAIILNYRRPQATVACLRSLKQTDYPQLNIVVIDNDSRDSSVEFVQREHPDVSIIQAPRNAGYAGGMNIGIRRALQNGSEFLFIANSDTEVAPETMLGLATALSDYPNAAAATGTIYYADRNTHRAWYAGGSIKYWRGSGFARHTLPDEDGERKRVVQTVTFVSGCAFLIRSAALRVTGLFDERFFLYLEDTELCSRLLRQHYQLLYVPAAPIYHNVTENGMKPLILYFTVRNRLFFLRHCAHGFDRVAGFIYVLTTLVLKTGFWILARRDLLRPTVEGVKDFFLGIMYEGNGLKFRERQS